MGGVRVTTVRLDTSNTVAQLSSRFSQLRSVAHFFGGVTMAVFTLWNQLMGQEMLVGFKILPLWIEKSIQPAG
jgi:hypothetical protein